MALTLIVHPKLGAVGFDRPELVIPSAEISLVFDFDDIPTESLTYVSSVCFESSVAGEDFPSLGIGAGWLLYFPTVPDLSNYGYGIGVYPILWASGKYIITAVPVSTYESILGVPFVLVKPMEAKSGELAYSFEPLPPM